MPRIGLIEFGLLRLEIPRGEAQIPRRDGEITWDPARAAIQRSGSDVHACGQAPPGQVRNRIGNTASLAHIAKILLGRSCPHTAIQRPVSHRLGDVGRLDLLGPLQVGDRPRHPQDLVTSARESPRSFIAAFKSDIDSGLRVQNFRTCRGVIRPLTWGPARRNA